MSKTVWKGSPLLAPVPPVLVTCAENGKSNIITVAWTGIISSDPPRTYISVRPERFSYGMIKNTGAFAVNLCSSYMARKVDFCGVRSGRDNDKFEKCSFTPEKASAVSVPLISEAPLSLECRVFDIIHSGSHDVFLADIVAVDVSDELIDENGRLRIEKASLLSYIHGSYFAQGKKVGSFGYSVKKKNGSKNKKS